MTRLYLCGAIGAALVAFGAYLYLDGRKDGRDALKAAQEAARIDDLKAARKRRDETESLSDDDLLDRLLERVRPIGPE